DLKLDLNKDNHEDTLDIKKAEIYLNGLEREIKKILDVSHQLETEKHENELTLGMLKHMTCEEINFDQLNECHYVSMRLGRIDATDKDKLQYLDKYPVFFYELGQDKHSIWCCYIVTNNYLLEVDNYFKGLGFEKVEIPDFVHGKMDEAKKELQSEVEAMQSYILNMNLKMDQLRISHQEELLKMYATASYLSKKEEYKIYVIDFKNQYGVYGFTPKDAVKNLKKQFKGIDSLEYQILPADVLEQQQIFAPKVVQNAKFVEPFEILSHIRKESIDENTVYAYAYVYYGIFALFFGDLGIGAIMVLIGLFMRSKKIGRLFLALGVATVLGGCIYGNVFYCISLYPEIIGFNTLFRIIDGVTLLVVGTIGIQILRDKCEIVNHLSSKGVLSIALIYLVMVYLLSLLENIFHFPLLPVAIVVVAILGLIVTLIRHKREK
ncbi:MAG: hypothetical protein LUH02_01810, partial [Erysipelotrichaceae bacterium]|nr:hypothetical protein [Erysipelotrichaceae bacterium]